MPEDTDFQTLIRRVRQGDQEAAQELVRRYEPSIRRVARVRLLDSRLHRLFDSMDICQSVLANFFVRAALGQYDLETPEQLLKLLVNMTRRKLIDRAREHGAARRDFHRIQPGSVKSGDLIATDPTPSQQVAGAELLAEFRKRLSLEERQLADQRCQGEEWDEIAARHGGSPEALRKKLARAVGRIEQELGLNE